MDRLHGRRFTRRRLLGAAGASLGAWPLLSRCTDAPPGSPDAGPGVDAGEPCRERPGPAPAQVSGYRGLADLPWFERDPRGELRCIACDLPPGIDFHTHLGFAYLVAPAVDQQRRCAVRYWLDCDEAEPPCTLALEGYVNTCTTAAVRKDMDDEMLRTFSAAGSERAATHTVANLLAEMDRMGVRRAVVHAIALGLSQGDDLTGDWLRAVRELGVEDRLVVYGSVHPSDAGWKQKLRGYAQAGIAGVKIHPTMQRIYPDAPATMEIIGECASLKLPVFFHAGRAGIEPPMIQPFAEMARYEAPVRDYQNVQFVFGHSGARDLEQALPLAKANANVWMDTAGPGLAELRRIVEVLGPERLLFGTDWPFYPQAATLARVLALTQGDRAVRDLVLRANAERLRAT